MFLRQSAVVRGAALRGLEGIAPRMKRARRHYGFKIAMPFREGIDPEDNAFIRNFDGLKYCEGRVEWLIAKASNKEYLPIPSLLICRFQGEKIFSETLRAHPVVRNYTPGEAFIAKTMLYSCALNDPPEYVSDTRTLCFDIEDDQDLN